jgi:hypothetical protein
MRVIVLNSSNLVQDGQNNKLIYKFPNSVFFKNNSIAVSSVSMYYSWFNISQALMNNKFSYSWTNGTTITTYEVVIPDGLYEIAQINAYLQFVMISNDTYLIDSSGKYVYYAEIVLNPTRYAVQLNTYLFPTLADLPAGYTTPVVGFVFPDESFNPVITFPTNFSNIVGYTAGFTSNNNVNDSFIAPTSPYVSKASDGTISYLSTQAPNVQPNSSIYFSLSNINNPYSQPSSIIYSLVPQGVVGTLITERPPQFMWNKMIDGAYNQLVLTFLGTDLNPIVIQDPSMTILLTIKDPEEYGGK